jgi:ATP-dependent Clp protease ATP-binding subunit ClpC
LGSLVVPEPVSGKIPFTPRAKKVLELALREALLFGHNYIGTEHLLLGLLDEEESLGDSTLADLGVTRERVREWLVPELEQLAEAKRRAG